MTASNLKSEACQVAWDNLRLLRRRNVWEKQFIKIYIYFFLAAAGYLLSKKRNRANFLHTKTYTVSMATQGKLLWAAWSAYGHSEEFIHHLEVNRTKWTERKTSSSEQCTNRENNALKICMQLLNPHNEVTSVARLRATGRNNPARPLSIPKCEGIY